MNHPAPSASPFFPGLPRWRSFCQAVSGLVAFVASGGGQAAVGAPLRAGMIGLDTSHVPAFVKLFNDPKAAGDLTGIRIVAGYPGGTDRSRARRVLR